MHRRTLYNLYQFLCVGAKFTLNLYLFFVCRLLQVHDIIF